VPALDLAALKEFNSDPQ